MKAYVPRLGLEDTSMFFSELIDGLTDRGRALIGRKEIRERIQRGDLLALSELLLSRRGEASGVALAQTLLATYGASRRPGTSRILQRTWGKVRPGCKKAGACRRNLPRRGERRCRQRASWGSRAPAAGAIPTAESCAWRNGGSRPHARRPPRLFTGRTRTPRR